MLLLTGATGLVGSALLRRLIAENESVRCLVRDPRRLGPQRVHVQIALGDLSDPRSFRNAMRGVDTVVHLATTTRDQPRGTIEELTAMASWQIAQAAEKAGVNRFLLLSALDAYPHQSSRLLRSKAVAEHTLLLSSLRSIVVASSFTYAPGDRWLKLIERLSMLPVVPVPGSGRARCQPIWVEDLADCLMAILRADEPGDRYELAGPQTLTYDEAIRNVMSSVRRRRPLVHVPAPVSERSLRLLERAFDGASPLTWDEAQLLRADCLTERGSADAEALGVTPRAMSAVLGFQQ